MSNKQNIHRKTFNALWDATIRLDQIVWLAGAVEGFSDDDFFEDVILSAHEKAPYMHESMHIFSKVPEWAMEDPGMLQEWMMDDGFFGFIVKVTTPKPIRFYKNGYSDSGFGYTSSTYMYVENIEDAVPMAQKWKQEQMIKWREEFEAREPA
jgi:hypothetical protein